jgi:4-amino-4-deoxy-L-arabinose transferase-like glycosyltransferase
MGCLGKSIAEGRGFSDPFCVGTGPSAWEPPLYPYLIGGVFKIFGTYSYASAWVLLTVNSLFSAVTCIPIYLIARRTLGEVEARWSTWAWALFPYVWYWSIHWVWDTTISPFLLALIFLIAVQLQDREGAGAWVWFGALWGVVALTNPSTISFLPVSGFWAWYRRHKAGRKSIAGVAVASLIFCAIVGPWLVRNHTVFGKWVFIRNDFGQQFALGNGEAARGYSMVYQQPNLNGRELERFKQLGELAYATARKDEAVEFIRANPARWVILTFEKFFYYWGGIPKAADNLAVTILKMSLFLASSLLAWWGAIRAVRRRRPGGWLYLLLLLVYPAIYYIVYPHARYRHPIEPEIMILAVFMFSELRRRGSGEAAEERTPANGAPLR